MGMRRPHAGNTAVMPERPSGSGFKPETSMRGGSSSVSRKYPSSSPDRSQRHTSAEATRNRLSIQKSAAFPMQQTAPKMFLSSCADITHHGRDWNAEFQLAWEMEDNTLSQAENRIETLRHIEREFVNEAMVTVKQIVTLDDNGPRELPKFLQCFRVDNIFFRVLPDSRSGRNYVSSLRGVLQSRTRLLTVPLSCMFFYRGMPVLAQALVPMPQQPTRLYGAGSTNDPEVEAEVISMANALNIQFPDATLEVYEGLDGRFYVTNSNSTLTPLFPDDTIMKKQTMLRVCPNVTEGHGDTLALLENAEVQDAVVRACMESETRPITDCLKNVGELLHAHGVNMCLLKQVVQKIAPVDRFSGSTAKHVKKMLCIEMIARSIKQEFYVEVQGKRVAYDDEALGSSLSKHMGEAFASVNVFLSHFLEVISKKYGVVDEDEDLIRLLTDVRTRYKADIVSRVCALVGVTIEKSGKARMTWHAFVNARVLPDLTDPRLVRTLVERYQNVKTQKNHRYAFSWPIRWKAACWEGNYDEALKLVHETALAYRRRDGDASIAVLRSNRNVCEVCFATTEKNCIAEGRDLFPRVMSGYEELTCPITQGRRHIEYGYWLLRVASVYQPEDLITYRDCIEDAVESFYSAIAKLPAFLRSEHGSWLHLQPYKGLLECKQLLLSCSVNTRALVDHSIELSTIGWASDFFMLYLWDLALQLEAEGFYEDAIRVILTAITVSKKKPTISLNLPTLMVDAAHIYRSWDADKYGEHCITLMREAVDKASETFGTRSREFAVVMNNKGAVELELNRLGDARESLKRAGIAFKEAGVPKDDPDYRAYIENIVSLRQRGTARPAVRRGFLRRYPFLASRNEDFPFSDIRPLEDDVFVSLARQRVAAGENAAQAKGVEQSMKERVWEILRVLQDGVVLRRFPFLPANIHGVLTASLSLEKDKYFMNLAAKLQGCSEKALKRQLQGSIRDYVVKKAERAAQERLYIERLEHSFNETHGEYVNLMQPIYWQYVVEDDRFNKLTDQLQKFIELQASTSKLNEIRGAMNERVAELVAETFKWREEASQWLPPSKLCEVAAKDIAHDQHLCDLVRDRRIAATQGASPASLSEKDYYITRTLDALWERAVLTRTSQAIEDEAIHRMFPFLSERPHHQRLSSLRLLDDPAVMAVAAKLSKREDDPRLQAELSSVVRSMAARHRDATELKKWYYDVDSVTSGAISLDNVPKKRDDYYIELWQRRNVEQVQYGDDSPLVVGRTNQMDNRLAQLSALMRKVLANEHRRRQRLEAKYPFVDSRHNGYAIEALELEDDDAFMKLVEMRQQLIASPDATIDEIDRVAWQANNRAAKIAAQRAAQQEEFKRQYPFLPSRLDGIESSALQLDDNSAFTEKAAQCLELVDSNGTENKTRKPRLEGEMENIAVAIAREVNIRKWRAAVESEDLLERFPFLPEEPARGVQLGDLRPVQEFEFRALSNQLDEFRRDPTQNAAAIRETEDKLCEFVAKMAEERVAATERARAGYPFLPMRVLGVPLGVLPLQDDELFATTASSGFKGQEALLVRRATQMAANHQLTEAQLADGDDAVLAHHPYLIYTSRKCFPLRHLPLQDDGPFNELLEDYQSLMQQTATDGDSAALLRLKLAWRADELAIKEITKILRIRDSFVALQPLSLEDLLHLQDRREFQNFADGSSVSPASPVQLREAKQFIDDDREARAAKMHEVDALRKTYPMLGRDIDSNMLEDPVIAQMLNTHEEMKNVNPHEENDLIKLQEQMAQRVGEVKAQQRTDSHTPQVHSPRTPVYEPILSFYTLDDEVHDDPYYAQLVSELKVIEDRNEPDDSNRLSRIKSQMERRKAQIARYNSLQAQNDQREAARTLQQFPFLSQKVLGVPIEALHLEDDREMMQMENDRQAQIKSGESVASIENDMQKRARTIAQGLRAEEDALATALPFLTRSVKGVPLRELAPLADPHFAGLAEQHARVGPYGDAAERSRLEAEMSEQAGRMACDARAARRYAGVRSEDLYERFPFLPEEPARGVQLGDLRPVQEPEFRALSNQLDELRHDPAQNAAAIREAEDDLCEVVAKMAEERAAATERACEDYPFLPMRVLGVPLGVLPLQDDDTFSQLAQRRAQEMEHPSGAKDASATEEEMLRRAEALAATVKQADADQCESTEYVRARHPFLVTEDRKCLLLDEIPLAGDDTYQKLYESWLKALEDVEGNAAHIDKLEADLCERADKLALGEFANQQSLLERYPFLTPHNVPGWAEALHRDAEFQELCARHDELSADPVKNAAELRKLEDAMNARGAAVADALRAADPATAQEQESARALHSAHLDRSNVANEDVTTQNGSEKHSNVLEEAAKKADETGLVDIGSGGKGLLLSVTSEEAAIECCEESEVIPFNINFRRKISRRRRPRSVRGGTHDSMDDSRASFFGEENVEGTKLGEADFSSIPKVEGEEDAICQAADDASEEANNEHAASVSKKTNEAQNISSADGDDGEIKPEDSLYTKSEEQRLHILCDELDARESLCRDALHHEECEEGKHLGLSCLSEEEDRQREKIISSYDELLDSIAEEKGRLAQEKGHLAEEEGHLAEDKGHLTEDEGRLAEDEGQLAEDKGHLAEDEGHLAEDEGNLAEDKERLTEDKGHLAEGTSGEKATENPAADESASIMLTEEGGEHDKAEIQGELGQLIRDERLARSNIADMETEEMGSIMLAGESEEIALQRGPRLAKEQSALFGNDESGKRDDIALKEDEEFEAMHEQFREGLSSIEEKEGALNLAVNEMMEEEEGKRQFLFNAEEECRQALHDTFEEKAILAKHAQENREAEEETLQRKERDRNAQELIRNVIHSYQVRKRLGSRFSNRKAQEFRNAIENVFRNEFTTRKEVCDEEKSERNQIELQANSSMSSRRLSCRYLEKLEKEEDEIRHQHFDDAMFQIQNLQRAFKKILAKHNHAAPSLQKLKEYEDRVNGRDSATADDNDADSDEGNDDDPLETGNYKGYALDPMGMFLLQYERDLRRFKASLEKNRQLVAAEHDMLKKARDNVTQEIVYSGTEALWIPTKPLPLSDLVQGPSAQFRRGRIADARGQRLSSKGPVKDGRTRGFGEDSVF